MDLLETPMEALVFRYFATAAGSLWAWIAVIAAALGLWRIRTSSGPKSDAPPHPAPTDPKLIPVLRPPTAPAPPSPAPASPSPPCHVEGGSTPKGRFTAYFHVMGSSIGDGGVEDGECGGGDAGGESAGSLMWKAWGWEEVVARTRGDLGWYRYQDLTALNGSVVRLWDGEGGPTAKSRRGLRRRI